MFLWSQHGRSGNDQLEFRVDDLLGPTDTEVDKAINRTRSRKANFWLRVMPGTRDVLAVKNIAVSDTDACSLRVLHARLNPLHTLRKRVPLSMIVLVDGVRCSPLCMLFIRSIIFFL